MNIYQPYTYLVGWTHLNKFYYGVRYAKGCNPSDLWNKYFTSSRYVKHLREVQGEPDVIQVRRTFADADSAISWETKVLRRIKIFEFQDVWLNKNINGAFHPSITSLANKGRKRSKEAIQKAIETRKKNGKPSALKGRKNPKISAALKGKPGVNLGKKFGPQSEITKQKQLESRRKYYENEGKGPNVGKVMSEEQKLKISSSSKGHTKPKSHSEKLRAIAKTRYKIKKEDGTWTWGYKTT